MLNTFFTQLKQDGSRHFAADAMAGMIAAAIVLPKAMAYATLAGLPVVVGLYTAFIPMLIYAMLGSSPILSVSTTTTIGILTGAQLHFVVPDGDPLQLSLATATLTLLVGMLLLLAALFRLGVVANFISSPILTGFKAGIGLVIILDQIPKLLGLHIVKQGFIRDLLSLIHHVPDSSPLTLLLSCISLLLLIIAERIKPHSPAPIVVVMLSICTSWWLDLQGKGVAIVGHIPQSLPVMTWPDLALVEQLLPGALGIALMSFTESIAAARAFAHHRDASINPDRELLGLGIANLGGALSGAMPAGGGTTQTAVMQAAGARSQWAAVITALFAAATMLVLAPTLALLPQATLSAIVVIYSIGLIQPAEFLAIRKVRYMEYWWAIIASLGVLLFGTLQGIVVAMIVSLLGLSSQTAHPQIYIIGRKKGTHVLRPLSPQYPDDETFDGLLIVRPEGRIYFVNAPQIANQIGLLVKEHQPRVLVLDMSRVPDIEYSALQMLIEREQRVTEHGAVLWLAALNPVVLEVVRRSGFADYLGRERMLFNASLAIERYQAMYHDQPAPPKS